MSPFERVIFLQNQNSLSYINKRAHCELAKSPLWLHFKITSIWTFLEIDKKSTDFIKNFYWESYDSYRMKSQEAFWCLIQFSTFSFEQFKSWTSVLFAAFYLWRASSDLIMTAVRSNWSKGPNSIMEYRLFEQYKFSIDSITNKTFWISKLFSEIICNEIFIHIVAASASSLLGQ